jgi:hypothetical protein
MTTIEAALAHLEAVSKGNPLGTPGESLNTPAGKVEVAGGLDPNPGEKKDVEKAADADPDEQPVDMGQEGEGNGEEDGEPMSKGLVSYFGMDLAKALTDEANAESPLAVLCKAIDLFTGDVTESIGAQFMALGPVNEALVKGLSVAIERVDAQADLIKGLIESQNVMASKLNATAAELIRMGGQPVPKKSLEPGQTVLEKGLPGNQPVGTGPGVPATSANDPFHGVGKAECIRKAIEGNSKGLIPIGAVQGIDRVGLSQEHFDLVKAL